MFTKRKLLRRQRRTAASHYVAHTQIPAKINTNAASYSQLVLKSNMPASASCRESHSGPGFFCIFPPTFCKFRNSRHLPLRLSR